MCLYLLYTTFIPTIVYLFLPLDVPEDQIALQVTLRQHRSLHLLRSLRSARSLRSFLMCLYLLYTTFTPNIVYLVLPLEASGGH